TTPLLNATDVTVNITVIDTSGYVAYDEALVPIIDSDGPDVLTTTPSSGQSDVALDQDVTILFDESMNTTSDSYITVNPDPGGWMWTWVTTSFENDTVIGSHNAFAQGQFYELVIGTGAKDDSDPGTPMSSDYTWNFTTVMIGTVPSCSVLVPTGAESWTGSTLHAIEWWMNDDLTATENLDVYLNYSSSAGFGSIVALTPSGMASPPFIYDWNVVTIDANDVVIEITVVDENGFVTTNTSAQFEIDSTPPAVTSTVPLNGATDVPRNSNVQATWDEGMNVSSAEGAFSLVDNTTWTAVPGAFSWAANALTFDPAALLNPDEWFTANFSDTAADDSDPGNMASRFSWSFRTTSLVDNFPPNITQLSVNPTPQEVYFNINISANVTDDFGLQSVSVNVTWPDSSWSNESMSPAAGDIFFRDRSYDLLGSYSFTIWAGDTSGNWNSSIDGFEVVDTTPPTLTHIPAGPWLADEPIDLTVTAVDNFLLSSVRINYTDTSGVVHNETMSLLSGDDYSHQIAGQSQTGTIMYFFWANDSSGNEARSPTYGAEVVETTPLPPTNLTVTAGSRGTLLLEWDAPTRNEDGSALTDLQGYNVYRMTESGGVPVLVNAQLVPEQEPYFLDENLRDGETYYYVVRAMNSRGVESANSEEASGTTTKPQVDDYTWIILIIIIIIAVVLIVLYMRRKKEDIPEADEEPPVDESQSEQI
ncbi:MAG: Ig-like domain-containing protein, partial [Thermoplasmata archaeon]